MTAAVTPLTTTGAGGRVGCALLPRIAAVGAEPVEERDTARMLGAV
ncbi:hypothetical protein [Microbacterium sp. 18062]|nr:hypothetical protein [Microbacterium sp. 18062]